MTDDKWQALIEKVIHGDETDYQNALRELDGMFEDGSAFRVLTPEEEVEWRKSAQENYKPGEPINPLWHPVYRHECAAINLEAYRKNAFLEK